MRGDDGHVLPIPAGVVELTAVQIKKALNDSSFGVHVRAMEAHGPEQYHLDDNAPRSEMTEMTSHRGRGALTLGWYCSGPFASMARTWTTFEVRFDNVESAVRNYVDGAPDSWYQYLAPIEFAINNSYSTAIGTTPLFLLSGSGGCGGARDLFIDDTDGAAITLLTPGGRGYPLAAAQRAAAARRAAAAHRLVTRWGAFFTLPKLDAQCSRVTT